MDNRSITVPLKDIVKIYNTSRSGVKHVLYYLKPNFINFEIISSNKKLRVWNFIVKEDIIENIYIIDTLLFFYNDSMDPRASVIFENDLFDIWNKILTIEPSKESEKENMGKNESCSKICYDWTVLFLCLPIFIPFFVYIMVDNKFNIKIKNDRLLNYKIEHQHKSKHNFMEMLDGENIEIYENFLDEDL